MYLSFRDKKNKYHIKHTISPNGIDFLGGKVYFQRIHPSNVQNIILKSHVAAFSVSVKEMGINFSCTQSDVERRTINTVWVLRSTVWMRLYSDK